MKSTGYIFGLVLLGSGLLGGCASSNHNPQPAALAVPWSGGSVSKNSCNVWLADGDVAIGRNPLAAVVATESSSVSAYTTYTYEAQPLGIPGAGGNWGTRYRWATQSGVSVP